MADQSQQQLTQQLQALADVTTALNSSLNLDEVLDRILANIERVVPHDAANIMLIEGDIARVVRGRGYEERGLADLILSRSYPYRELSDMRRLVEQAEVVLIDNTGQYKEWQGMPETDWVKCLLGVPIEHQGEVIGLINLDSAQPHFFTREQATYLKLFADQAAIAIQNARLYEQVQRHAAHLEEQVAARTNELETANQKLRSQIDERERIEQALRDSEKKYRSLYTAMREGLALYELLYDDAGKPVDYQLLDVNPAYEATLNLKRKDVIGKRGSELFGATQPVYLTSFALVVQSGQPASFEIQTDQRHFIVSVFSPAEHQFATIFSDITDIRSAERALRTSEARYRGLFDNNPLGLYRTTVDGTFIDVNPSLVYILGYPDRQTLLDTDVKDVYADVHDREEAIDLAEKIGDLRNHEVRFKRFDGSNIWISDTARPILNAEGEVLFFEGAIQDITDRKQVEQENQLYAEIMNQAGIGLMIWELPDLDDPLSLHIVAGNPAFSRITQTDVDRLLFRPYLEINFADHTGPVNVIQVIRTGIAMDYEVSWLENPLLPDIELQVRIFPLGKNRAGVAFEDITERKKSRRAEQEQRHLAEALRDVTAALNSTLNFEELLGRILINVEQVVPHVRADVMMIENEMAYIVRSNQHGQHQETAYIEPSWKVEETPNLKWMRDNRQAMFIKDTRENDDWIYTPATSWIRSYVGAPIMLDSEVLGYINLSNNQPDYYNNEHVQRLQAFADQTAVAVRNARLYETITRRQRYLETLHRISRRAVPVHNRDELMQAVVNGLATEFGYEIAGILLVDEKHNVLRQAAAAGSHPIVAKVGLSYTQPLKSGIMGWVVEHNQPRMVNDTATDLDYNKPDGGIDSGSVLAAPLRQWGRAIGVLNILSTRRNAFDDLDREALLELAEDLALYLENLTLNEQAKVAATLAERNRLARDLHDSVTQSLYSLTLFTEAARQHALNDDMEQAQEYLERIGRIGQQAVKEMRLLVYELRPETLEQEGLIGALRRRLETVERRAGVQTRFVSEHLIDLPGQIEEELYRIAQEALNNALKHADASMVCIRIGIEDNRVQLMIEDDGAGFDSDDMPNSGGIGLSSMRERAEKINATLTITSPPGEGTTVTVSVEVDDHSDHVL